MSVPPSPDDTKRKSRFSWRASAAVALGANPEIRERLRVAAALAEALAEVEAEAKISHINQ
jgi:hypothetical protein